MIAMTVTMIGKWLLFLLLVQTREGSQDYNRTRLFATLGSAHLAKVNIQEGDSVNITFFIWRQRGGTGFIDVEQPRLEFNIMEGKEHLLKAPDQINLGIKDEESCSAADSGKSVPTEELVTNVTISIKTTFPGKTVMSPKGIPDIIDTSKATVTFSIVRSNRLEVFIHLIGWLYFCLWSVSFYPQIILNFKRKSVAGLNLDFVVLNLLGFSLYSGYNLCLYCNMEVRAEYFAQHQRGVIPVQLNDVVFSLHALLATSVTAAQCLVLEKTGQTVSIPCRAFLIITAVVILISIILSLTTVTNWLTTLNILATIKLVITLIKYIPQAWANYRHKSTRGWSVDNIQLDLGGGLSSLLQIVLVAHNSRDWDSLTGNPTKLGLAGVSLVFDFLFLAQHFVLYRNKEPYQLIQ